MFFLINPENQKYFEPVTIIASLLESKKELISRLREISQKVQSVLSNYKNVSLQAGAVLEIGIELIRSRMEGIAPKPSFARQAPLRPATPSPASRFFYIFWLIMYI